MKCRLYYQITTGVALMQGKGTFDARCGPAALSRLGLNRHSAKVALDMVFSTWRLVILGKPCHYQPSSWCRHMKIPGKSEFLVRWSLINSGQVSTNFAKWLRLPSKVIFISITSATLSRHLSVCLQEHSFPGRPLVPEYWPSLSWLRLLSLYSAIPSSM